jgi:pyruvate/2-oxoglutarate dehydrogenase complex dihydrolipoamide dehydrogenase (E3) component
MMQTYPLVVIGAGAGGLVVAIGAAKAGKKVLLIERGTYGGDCTNFGCIPSKSLIASAHGAHVLKEGISLGLDLSSSAAHMERALSRTRAIVEKVRSQEDPSALLKVGVETITGEAFFTQPHCLQINDQKIHAKQIVIATGSSPFIPSIPGLSEAPYLTNETIFALKQIPQSLAVLGGGPIGSELSQAFQRLGAQVTLIHTRDALLGREDPLAQTVLAKQLEKEGISLLLGRHTEKIQYQNGKFYILLDNEATVEADALLVCVGRRPNVAHLNLQAAGVEYSSKGIPVDAYGRTNQRHIWAVGDVVGAPFFTHLAENQARSVLTSLLLPFKKKLDRAQAIPRVTYTDPEIASIGMTEKDAAESFNIATYVVPFSSVDRAITTSREEGFIKIVTKKWSSQILGCTIVAPRAGEMLGEISLAMHARIPLRKLAQLIHPYPTYNQAIRKAADLWLTQTILKSFRKSPR